MARLKEKIIKEVEKIPEDKMAKLYEVIHSFRVGIKTERKEIKDSRQKALKFFGVWKNMSPEETAVLDEIQSRRKRTYRERVL